MPAVTDLSMLAPGAQVVVRDEEWLVRAAQPTRTDGIMVQVTGTSELVRDTEATFFSSLDAITPMRPEDTTLVADPTPNFRRSRLWIESLLRRAPLPAEETRLAAAHRQLLDELDYQRRPVQVALEALRPRLLIADAVGLGKTLEVGMILTELIRRGRGERILVVTPRHILEQFQHEMWTRFAIPLVRLDSEGIQRVRQRIPATRNPFTYYSRAIISIDTLKNAGAYRHHLEGIRWDAVVIDECHSLINRGTLNNQLARVLAPRTDALILTSATPHNGQPESFAELVAMLDPTAIADPKHYERADIDHLYVRRHKNSSEVAAEVGRMWADRLAPQGIHVPASPAEEAVFAELADTWLAPMNGSTPGTGKGHKLFPYTLLKAYLSSHRALAETVANRRKVLAGTLDAPKPVSASAPTVSSGPDIEGSANVERSANGEDAALERLAELVDHIDDASATKLAALADALVGCGIGPGATTRAVVFSERHATLEWLAATLPQRLGLPPDAVRLLHGGLADVVQQDVVEEFALAESPVRLLLTGDIASEGVNLHRQCHLLFHFDLPWSLITIEQRNGRIDRYGQVHAPEIRALLMDSRNATISGDLVVLDKLLAKEHAAHLALGDVSGLMGLHSPAAEEHAITQAVAAGDDLDAVVPDAPVDGFDLLLLLTGEGVDEPVQTMDPPSLFACDADFVDAALSETFTDPAASLDLRRETDVGLLSLAPPPDLCRRLEVLPQGYLAERKVLERIKVTSDRAVAEQSLAVARSADDTIWPEVMFLSAQHPLVEWLVDKVLVTVGRNEAPVLVGAVADPTFLIQGVFANHRHQPTITEWFGVDGLGATPRVRPLAEVLAAAKIGPTTPNPATPLDLGTLQALVPVAVTAAREYLSGIRVERARAVGEPIRVHARRLRAWQATATTRAEALAGPARIKRLADIAAIEADTSSLIESMATRGDPMVRIVGAILPAG